MVHPDPAESAREQRLNQVIADYLASVEAGRPMDRRELLAQHADLADDLAAFFADHDRPRELVAPMAAAGEATLSYHPSPAETATLPPQPAEEEMARLPPGATVGVSSLGSTVRYFGDYELLEEIARGGMGVVYRARQVSLNRIVALKMILAGQLASDAEVKRFYTEAEAAAQLDHPGIVPIFEVGQHEGQHYFSMGFIEGQSLAAKVARNPLEPREAAALIKAVAEAVDYAHQKGVIHRDLKPENVLLDKDGHPRITDFGLAKRVKGDSQLTSTGQILGTPSYMPPEQAAGKAEEVGAPADIYALGAVLYRLLTGRPPFQAAAVMDTLLQVLEREPVAVRQLNPRVPRDLETIALKCLEKNPQRRYASACDLAEELGRYLARRPIRARPVSTAERLWRWGRRNPTRAVAAAVALVSLLVIVVGGVWFHRRLQEQLRQTQAAERQLQTALTGEAAERLDSELKQLAAVPQLMAATLTQRTDWTEPQLEAWMRETLQRYPLVFGICVAFEPYAFDPARQDYALYVCRVPDGLATKRLLPPAYSPLYREWPWYTKARAERRALWSEPFLDEGGGNVPMITQSVPLERHGKVVGVVTADLSLDYFNVLHAWLEELQVGRGGYAFLVSDTGTFISHPNPEYRLPRKITAVPEFQEDRDLAEIARQMLAQETGRMRAVDPWTGLPSSFLFAPIRSTRWSLAVVIADHEQATK